ncbi:Uncharacterised protein [Mycobacteroides abscessus subsp. abscessus]|nr:Uncharacterised protein [Mycobacteroides abscessus subsp. abscessus]
MTENSEYRGPAQHPHRTLWQRFRDWWLMRKAQR